MNAIQAHLTFGRKPPLTELVKNAFMTTIAARLKRRMDELKDAGRPVTVAQIADACGISRQAVYQWLAGDSSSLKADNLLKTARLLGVNENWLQNGKGSKFKEAPNIAPGPDLKSKVPVINWTTAGSWAEIVDSLHVGEAEGWVDTTIKVGPNAFAVRVVGDSMEPRIPDGAIVVIDPARQHKHGSIVLAKRTADQQATLKMLWYDGATPYLKPLNDRYAMLEMPADTRIIGVAVQSITDL